MIRTIAVAAGVISLLAGCASIVSGSSQSLTVNTKLNDQDVSGAKCWLKNNKGSWALTSPGSAVVNRSFEDLSVRCEKDGVEPGVATFKSSTKAMAFGNILFGGIIGAGVDMSTGAAYDYPNVLTVEMGKTIVVAPAAASAPAGASAPEAGASATAAAAPAAAPAASAASAASTTPVASTK